MEMGSGNGVGRPESEDRPAATTTEVLDADRGCVEETVLVDWTGSHCIFCLRFFILAEFACASVGSFVLRREPKWLQEVTYRILFQS